MLEQLGITQTGSSDCAQLRPSTELARSFHIHARVLSLQSRAFAENHLFCTKASPKAPAVTRCFCALVESVRGGHRHWCLPSRPPLLPPAVAETSRQDGGNLQCVIFVYSGEMI